MQAEDEKCGRSAAVGLHTFPKVELYKLVPQTEVEAGTVMISGIFKLWWLSWIILLMSLLQRSAAAQSNPGQAGLVLADTGFGFRLLKQLAQETDANVFISPYSISTVLQMVSVGARGQTQQELQEALGTTNLNQNEVNAAYQHLNQAFLGQTNVTLNVANALWYRTGADLNQSFTEINQTFYGAALAALDFSNPESASRMNQWAAENTHDKIQTIISPPIPADTAMILANAIYFKGTWLNQFDAKQTSPRAFNFLKAPPQPVPMMQQTRSFLYQEGDGFQAVELPYAGRGLAMQILLPATNSSIRALVGQMDQGFWDRRVLSRFQERKGTLVLPRFTLRYGADLKAPLSAMGAKSALTPNADFTGMSSSRLYLSKIEHQSFVEVNEQGTEAAAVTTAVIALASFPNQPPPFQMVVDRPFLFVISDQKTKSILFIGVVLDPGGSVR